jgi:hypothetical protein
MPICACSFASTSAKVWFHFLSPRPASQSLDNFARRLIVLFNAVMPWEPAADPYKTVKFPLVCEDVPWQPQGSFDPEDKNRFSRPYLISAKRSGSTF